MKVAIMVILTIIAGVFFSVLFTAVAVGAGNSWIMQDTFANGWDAAWDRWPITLGFGILFGGSLGGSAYNR